MEKQPAFTFSVPKSMADKLKNFATLEPEKVNVYMVDNDDKIICKGVKQVKGKTVLKPFKGKKVGNIITIS